MLRAFLSYRYSLSSQSLPDTVGRLLLRLGVESVDGKHLTPPQELSEQLKSVIRNCDILVSICTDSENRAYLEREATFAAGCGKPIVFITQDGLLPGGLFSDFYLISFEGGEFQAAADIITAINSIKTKLTLTTEPILAQHSAEDEIDREQWTSEVRLRLREIRCLFNCLDYQGAQQKASGLFSSHPDCWRAGIALSAALVFLHKFDDADQVLDQLITSFAGNARTLSHAYQNKAWLRYTRMNMLSGNEEQTIVTAINFFRRSLDYEPRLIVYIDLIIVLLNANQVQDAETVLFECLNHFPDTKKAFRKQLKVKGADFLQEIAKSSVLLKILFPKEQQGDEEDDE